MANPSTPSQPAASDIVDEAVRIAAEGSRRTADSAKTALQGFRSYLDQVNQVNRDLFALMSDCIDAAFQTAFDTQSAALANTQSWLEASSMISKTAFNRYADLTRQAQATTLNAFHAGTSLFDEMLTTTE